MTRLRAHRKKLIALGALVLLPLLAHLVVGRMTTIRPTDPAGPPFAVSEQAGVRRTEKAWAAVRCVRVVLLSGTPAEIGAQHTTLLRDRMMLDEQVLWDGFASVVPFAPARTLLFDVGRVRYRDVAANFPPERRAELAAEASAFVPDPYEHNLPTYHRMVMLHALYDIALGFEHSPLLGCTAFGLGPELTENGHALFARAFDFEAADVFDEDKTVFVVHEDGKIPFASVAWPGFVGVVTGMNAEGVAVAVHGGRAREPSITGTPVAASLREVLSSARTTDEAVAILTRQSVMVSHIVFVGDASGHFSVVERAPGIAPYVRNAPTITNHFEGPLANDARDRDVRATTTTLQRRERIDELMAEVKPKSASVPSVLAMLRDHDCSGHRCRLGDRRAIDAFIATHGIVADLTEKALWVSQGPHLSGRFVKIDPATLVRRSDGHLPEVPALEALESLPPDPILQDRQRYEDARERAGGPLLKVRK